MLAHMLLILSYVIWCNANSCGLEVTMTALHECPASSGNIIFSVSSLPSKHEIVPRVNESAFINFYACMRFPIGNGHHSNKFNTASNLCIVKSNAY